MSVKTNGPKAQYVTIDELLKNMPGARAPHKSGLLQLLEVIWPGKELTTTINLSSGSIEQQTIIILVSVNWLSDSIKIGSSKTDTPFHFLHLEAWICHVREIPTPVGWQGFNLQVSHCHFTSRTTNSKDELACQAGPEASVSSLPHPHHSRHGQKP